MVKNLIGRKVKTARIHQPGQAEGYGQITNPISATNSSIKTLTMTVIDSGLLCTGNSLGKTFEFFIPMQNIVSFDLMPETKEETKTA